MILTLELHRAPRVSIIDGGEVIPVAYGGGGLEDIQALDKIFGKGRVFLRQKGLDRYITLIKDTSTVHSAAVAKIRHLHTEME